MQHLLKAFQAVEKDLKKNVETKWQLGRRLVHHFPGRCKEDLWKIAGDALGSVLGGDEQAEVARWMLGQVCFVKHASVKTGGYTYDEPNDDKDPRLVPLGDVPAIAFSEAVGDLVAIAGRKEVGEDGEQS